MLLLVTIFCDKTALEMQEMAFKHMKIKNFLGEHTPGPPREFSHLPCLDIPSYPAYLPMVVTVQVFKQKFLMVRGRG